MTPDEALDVLVTTSHQADLEDRKVLDEAKKILQECIVAKSFWEDST